MGIGQQRLVVRPAADFPAGEDRGAPIGVPLAQLGVLTDLAREPVGNRPTPPARRCQRHNGQARQLQAALVITAALAGVRRWAPPIPQIGLGVAAGDPRQERGPGPSPGIAGPVRPAVDAVCYYPAARICGELSLILLRSHLPQVSACSWQVSATCSRAASRTACAACSRITQAISACCAVR